MHSDSYYEANVVAGLEAIARDELSQRLGSQFKLLRAGENPPGVLQFHFSGEIARLIQLKTVSAVFSVQHFAVPRPKALLGHQHFQRLLNQLNAARSLFPKGSFKTLYLAAAGSDSTVMLRVRRELARALGLAISDEEGDLLLRIRRSSARQEGWEAAVRLSPRPLSVRQWRVCDLAGALNASIAHAAAILSDPTPTDIFLNLACGSGSMLIERLAAAPAKLALGCDLNPAALACARENIRASQLGGSLQVYPWDARALPLPAQSIDAIAADLPFGHDIGSHKDNELLYPQVLQEAARVARPNARFVLISHEIRLMAALLESSADWITEQALPVTITGLHPRIYVLRRAQAGGGDEPTSQRQHSPTHR